MKHHLIKAGLSLIMLAVIAFSGCANQDIAGGTGASGKSEGTATRPASQEYVYPENTSAYYIESGIELPEGFLRPDLVWHIETPYGTDTDLPEKGQLYARFSWEKYADCSEDQKFALKFGCYDFGKIWITINTKNN